MLKESDTESGNTPRSLRSPAVCERRRAMLDLPHVAPLTSYVRELSVLYSNSAQVPFFDPCDGGTGAEALFLLEKPGPMTATTAEVKRFGSGFISRDNDDPTAENIFWFMRQAGLPRRQTVIWNVIPAWNGTRKITSVEHQEGISHVHELITLLPKLHAIVMVGRRAARARPYLEGTGLSLFASAHPSPILRATNISRWRQIPVEWTKVTECLAPVSNTI